MWFRGQIAVLWLCCGVVICEAQPPPGYYDSAEGKAGPELRQALHMIIQGHTVIPYSSPNFDTSDALKVLDEDPANTNNVILIYSDRSEPKITFGFLTGWNREHLWPNSYGIDDRPPAYSDLHNLRAADLNVNSARGNKLFDISNTNDLLYQFPASLEALLTSTDSDSWEPPSASKGDIARAVFYMAVRYSGPTNGPEPVLFLTDALRQISSSTNLMGRLSTLLLWHMTDPVNDTERLRNEKIFTLYQHSRNPFVDRPEWVVSVFHPQLIIVRDNTTATLRWPGRFVGAIVESAQTFNEGWEIVAGMPVLTNMSWQLSVPLEGEFTLFRLHLR